MKPRILVIRGGAIGDFVLTLPAIKLLRENFPQAHLEILGYRHIVALAEGRFYADSTRSIEYGPLSRFFIPNAELPGELMEYFGSFHQVVSFLYDPDRFFEMNLLRCGVKHFIHGSPKIDDTDHASIQLARPLERLALYHDGRAATLHPNSADRAFAESYFDSVRHSSAPGRPLLALHPGSGSERKNWPLDSWLALTGLLRSFQPQPRLLLIGGEADADRIAALSRERRDEPFLLAQNMPLPHLAALLERCALFVGHDSGISHIAAAVGAPCVLLFGPTDPEIWAPRNDRVRVLQAAGDAMENLGPDTVAAAICDALAEPAAPEEEPRAPGDRPTPSV